MIKAQFCRTIGDDSFTIGKKSSTGAKAVRLQGRISHGAVAVGVR